MFGTAKVATVAVTVVLSLAVTGAAALAAFQPPAETALVAATDTGVMTGMQAERDGDALRAALERLVQNGTITQGQAETILKAVREAAGEKNEKKKDAKERSREREAAAHLKLVFGGMLKLSVEYIGLPAQAVSGQLKAGKSLAEIASTQPGKSREGLISHLETRISAQLDKAVVEGKITQQRADEVKTHLTERVTKFVDHKHERKPPAKERKPVERGDKKPAASPSAKPTT